MPQTESELVATLNEKRNIIREIKDELNKLDTEKEAWFKKKGDFSKTIKALISQIKALKEQRNTLTEEVKTHKKKRDEFNKELKEKAPELEKGNEEWKQLAGKFGIKRSPSQLKKEIERLDTRIETEALSFEDEKKVMKKLKALKKEYDQLSDMDEKRQDARQLSSEVRELRQEAEVKHKFVQRKAGESQKLHEQVIEISKKIDALKVEEEAAFQKFAELKKKFNGVNSKLKEELEGMASIKRELDSIKGERLEKKRQKDESKVAAKQQDVEEKIKKGQKLTTEDLLVFQKELQKK